MARSTERCGATGTSRILRISGGKIDLGGKAHRPHHLAAADDALVENIPCPQQIVATVVLGAQHHALLQPVIALQDALERLFPGGTAHLNKEAQPAEIDTQDGDARGRA